MSKRPSAAEESQPPLAKRQRGSGLSTESLAQLLRQAEDLVDCLRNHQRSLTSADEASRLPLEQQLSKLSKNLLPSLQDLASGGEGTAARHNETESSILEDQTERNVHTVDSRNDSSSHASSRTILQTAGVPVPAPTATTPWVSSEIPGELPPLPKVLDPELEKAVFTHPGLPNSGPTYERLEWLGDAYIELLSTILIDQTFPKLAAGRCSQLREQLVRNVNLADYFLQYQMDARARLPTGFGHIKTFGRGRSKDKDLIKTQADMFEAYVAAAIISDSRDGLANTTAWLKALWGRTILDEIKKVEQAQLLPTPNQDMQPHMRDETSLPKSRLLKAIGVKGIHIRYEDLRSNKKDKLGMPILFVGAYLDGWGETNKLLGIGSALSKKEAGQKAAAAFLENRKLAKVYEDKKRAFVEAQAAVADGAHKTGA